MSVPLDCVRVGVLFQAAEQRLADITAGNSWGVCLGCYRLNELTKHHVQPKAVYKINRDWRPFTVMLCRKCHGLLHRLETNQNLYSKHQTLADVLKTIREEHTKPTNHLCNSPKPKTP